MPQDLVQTIEAKVLAAISADEAGDYARALQLMRQAQLAMSAIPDGSREEESFTFDRAAIGDAIASLQKKVNSRSGVKVHGVRYERG